MSYLFKRIKSSFIFDPEAFEDAYQAYSKGEISLNKLIDLTC